MTNVGVCNKWSHRLSLVGESFGENWALGRPRGQCCTPPQHLPWVRPGLWVAAAGPVPPPEQARGVHVLRRSSDPPRSQRPAHSYSKERRRMLEDDSGDGLEGKAVGSSDVWR